MANVKFYYFEAKALGEASRMLLAYGGQEFEDVRFVYETFNKSTIKSTSKFRQLPMLEIDGKQYAQSVAIARYLGRKYGLNGADIEEDFQIDEIVDFFYDIYSKGCQVHYEQNSEIKAKRHEEFSKNVYPSLLSKLDEIITANNGHLANGKISFVGMFDYVKVLLQIPDLEKQYPSFQKVLDAVLSLPKVQEYIAKAPKEDY